MASKGSAAFYKVNKGLPTPDCKICRTRSGGYYMKRNVGSIGWKDRSEESGNYISEKFEKLE